MEVLAEVTYLRRLEINLEGIENTKKIQNTHPKTHVEEMTTFRKFYEEQVGRVEQRMKEFRKKWKPQIESWFNKSGNFKEKHPTFINDLFLIGIKRQEEQRAKVGNFLKKYFPSINPEDPFRKTVNGWVTGAENLKNSDDVNLNKKPWTKKNWEARSSSRIIRKFDQWVDKQQREREEAIIEQEESERREKEREDERKFKYIQNVRSPAKNNDNNGYKVRYFS